MKHCTTYATSSPERTSFASARVSERGDGASRTETRWRQDARRPSDDRQLRVGARGNAPWAAPAPRCATISRPPSQRALFARLRSGDSAVRRARGADADKGTAEPSRAGRGLSSRIGKSRRRHPGAHRAGAMVRASRGLQGVDGPARRQPDTLQGAPICTVTVPGKCPRSYTQTSRVGQRCRRSAK